jgi:hypothetical protein
MTKTPDVFVWTKIGDDAREFIDGILMRKEAERRAGSFWWGIGSSLDRDKLQKALSLSKGTLPVLFSKQLSSPKRSAFGGMILWTRWMDGSGAHVIPGHAMVISKGRSARYYSLVCSSDEILSLSSQPFDEHLFWNFPDGARPGHSQNTALLTGNLQAEHGNGRYRIGFRATLVQPWLVTLAGPRLLTADEENLIANWNGDDYAALVRRIRRNPC